MNGSITSLPMLAIVVAREGRLPVGAAEAVSEAGGHVLVTGSGTRAAAAALISVTGPAPGAPAAAATALGDRGPTAAAAAAPADRRPSAAGAAPGAVRRVWLAELPGAGPGTLAAALAPVLAPAAVVLLPASSGGRDLAPRLAAAMGRPLLADAIRCGPDEAELARLDDRLSLLVAIDGPAVVTLRPRTRERPSAPVLVPPAPPASLAPSTPPTPSSTPPARSAGPAAGWPEVTALLLDLPRDVRDAELVAVLPPDPATADLAGARRIVCAGAGLVPAGQDGPAAMRLLAKVAAVLGASTGATRVVTDAGWLGHDRQIGVTGAMVDPDLHIALGVSGAAQHIGGIGSPAHVISVNTDPSCPMTAMASLGIVADAPAVLAELARRLGVAEETDA